MRITDAKRALHAQLAHKPNILGVGIGYATKRKLLTGEIAIVVFVNKKVRIELVPQALRIPSFFHSFRVDVVEHAVSRPCNCTSNP
jgi:hypothetical protein